MSTNNNDRNFIGRGWSFPPQFNLSSKTVAMTEGVEDIHNSLSILFSTIVGERVMDMRYGCNLDEWVFENLNLSTITLIKVRIEQAILFYEARIQPLHININTEDVLEGRLLIEVEYILRATNSRYNFVYPFWLEEGTELSSLLNP